MPSRHPILTSLQPVIDQARHVSLDSERMKRVAAGLAEREMPWPDFGNLPDAPPEDRADFFFVSNAVNFAFTDFETGEVFQVEIDGKIYQDADAMVACLRRAYQAGLPILAGSLLRRLDREQLAEIFTGSCRIPLLEQRLRQLTEVGAILEDEFQNRFHHFLSACPQRAYAGGDGLLERVPAVFPPFQDERIYRGARITFLKRAQLLLWQLHSHFRGSGYFRLADVDRLTIFADYIVPMALRQRGVLRYSSALERRIQKRELLPEGSEEEVEIRALSVWACHRMTREINKRRPSGRQIIEPLLDAFLWFNHHEDPGPHHLTRTTSY